MKAEVKKCNCSHESQDSIHGKGMRVHNHNEDSVKGGTQPRASCTVCGTEKNLRS